MHFTDYVEGSFQTFWKVTDEERKNAVKKLKEITPAPMNTMLEKEAKEDALQKKRQRSNLVTKEVPPTAPGKLVLPCK